MAGTGSGNSLEELGHVGERAASRSRSGPHAARARSNGRPAAGYGSTGDRTRRRSAARPSIERARERRPSPDSDRCVREHPPHRRSAGRVLMIRREPPASPSDGMGTGMATVCRGQENRLADTRACGTCTPSVTMQSSRHASRQSTTSSHRIDRVTRALGWTRVARSARASPGPAEQLVRRAPGSRRPCRCRGTPAFETTPRTLPGCARDQTIVQSADRVWRLRRARSGSRTPRPRRPARRRNETIPRASGPARHESGDARRWRRAGRRRTAGIRDSA